MSIKNFIALVPFRLGVINKQTKIKNICVIFIHPNIQVYIDDIANIIYLTFQVDVDDNEEIAASRRVVCMPTFQFFKSGYLLDKFAEPNRYYSMTVYFHISIFN